MSNVNGADASRGKRDCGPEDPNSPLFDDHFSHSINSLFLSLSVGTTSTTPISRGSVKASPQLLGRPRNMPLALLPAHIHVLRFLSSSPYLKPTTIVWPHSVLTFQISRSNRILCSPRRVAAIAPWLSVHSLRACRPDSAVMKNTSFCRYCVDRGVAAFKKPNRLL